MTLFDLCSSDGGLDLRTVKVLRNGTTVIHCEADGSRGVPVLLRLERSHGTLTWSRTPWNGNVVSGDLSLFSNPDVDITTGLKLKYGLGSGPSPPTGGAGGMGGASDGEVCGGGIEEGYLDVAALKEVALSCREGDFISIARRHGIRIQSIYTFQIIEINLSSLCSYSDVSRWSMVHFSGLRAEFKRQSCHSFRLLASGCPPLGLFFPSGSSSGSSATKWGRSSSFVAQRTISSTLLHVTCPQFIAIF